MTGKHASTFPNERVAAFMRTIWQNEAF